MLRISAQCALRTIPCARPAILPPVESGVCLHTASREREGVVFYRWPFTRHMRLISRLKMYQVSCMALLLPPMTYWYYGGVVSGKTLLYAWTAGLGTTAVFCALSLGLSRVVGELAYLAERDCLRVSTLSFMGGRRDRLFPAHSVLPPSEGGAGRAWQRLEFSGCREVLLYSRLYGRVLDAPLLRRLLGTKN